MKKLWSVGREAWAGLWLERWNALMGGMGFGVVVLIVQLLEK